jgi:hypothetical protein
VDLRYSEFSIVPLFSERRLVVGRRNSSNSQDVLDFKSTGILTGMQVEACLTQMKVSCATAKNAVHFKSRDLGAAMWFYSFMGLSLKAPAQLDF